jgi:hypothetical protein
MTAGLLYWTRLGFAKIIGLIFPEGQITRCCVEPLSRLRIISDFQKLSLTLDPNHLLIPCHPVPREGALAIVTDVGAGSGGRESCD